MSLINFLLFDLLSFIIHIFILLFAYRLFTKHKCNILSKIAEKEIKDYWGHYDDSDNSMDDFVESINIIDNNNNNNNNNNNSQNITQF